MGRETWTRERCLEALRRWVEDYGGAIPRAADWDEATVWHPTDTTVKHRFGTWNNFIAAGGYEPRPRKGWNGEESG